MRMVRIGEEKWRIIGVYANGNVKGIWERIRGWEDDRRKGIRTIVGGDFNARTGELGGWVEWSDEREEERGRKSRDKKVNREGRDLVDGLEEAGWYIFNGCRKGDEEGEWTYAGGGGNPY